MKNAIFYLYLRIINRFAAPVNAFSAEAERFADRSCEEERHADTAKALSGETEDAKRKEDFTRIAVWHYEKCATLCRKAAAEFETAAKSETNPTVRRNFQFQAAQILKRAARAEAEMLKLQPLQLTEENFTKSERRSNKMKNINAIVTNLLSSKLASQKTFASNAPEVLSISIAPETKRAAFFASAVLVLFLSLFLIGGEAKAATYTVNMDTDTNDVNSGDGICDSDSATPGEQCTLRAAIEEADYFPNVDNITFSLPVPSSIVLTNGELSIDTGMSIDGPGARALTIERGALGTANFRIFDINIDSNESVNISGVTITNGICDNLCNSGNFLAQEKGGGIYFDGGTLNLTAVTVRNNKSGRGGGIYIDSGTANITRSTFSNNIAKTNGGAIYNDATANISNTTVSGNNTTGNDPTFGGGGIFNALGNTTNLTNVTVSNNATPNQGGGIKTEGGTVNLRNTIVAQNTATIANPDVIGTFASNGNNLIGISAGNNGFTNGANGDKVGTSAAPINAMLSALQSNGGPTDTHALLQGSPAIDAGNNCVAELVPFGCLATPLVTDQRSTGFSRRLDGDNNGTSTVDIGAFEAVAPTASEVIVGGRIVTETGKGIRGIRVTVTMPNGDTLTAVSGKSGYYQFTDLSAGETYMFTVSAKRFTFNESVQVRTINESLNDVDFVASILKKGE